MISLMFSYELNDCFMAKLVVSIRERLVHCFDVCTASRSCEELCCNLVDTFGLRKVASFLDIVEILKELDSFTKRFRSIDLLDLAFDLGRVLVGRNTVQLEADTFFPFLLVEHYRNKRKWRWSTKRTFELTFSLRHCWLL